MDQPEPDRDDAHPLTVSVVRSGGIAGMRREWRARPDAADADRWRRMLSSCPWDEDAATGHGTDRSADRYVWRIRVDDADADPRMADVPDSALDGAWRELVDAVREDASAVSRADRASS